MSTEMHSKVQASPAQNFMPAQTGLLQRKSALYNTPELVEDSGRDKEKLTSQRSSIDQAGTTTLPRFGHDFSKVGVHSTGPGVVQTKPKISKSGNFYEQEADQVADVVMRMPEPGVQRVVDPEEEEEEEEPIQAMFASGLTGSLQAKTEESQNKTGMPDHLKSGLEKLSSLNLSSVRVHHNSSKPAQLNALAYTQGQDIHVGPNQENHLPHEGWHAVQQMQGRVKTTMQAKGVPINDDAGLEREADVMGLKAMQKMHVSRNSNAEVNDTFSLENSGSSTNKAIQMTSGLVLPLGAFAPQTTQGPQKVNDCTKNNQGFPKAEFTCYYNNMLTYHKGLYKKRSTVLNNLATVAGKEDPPPFWHDLAVAALGIALAAATGGIGAAVAVGVSNKLAKLVLDPKSNTNFIKIVSDMAKDGAKAATKEVVGEKVKKVSKGNPNTANIFFHSQSLALIDVETAAEVDMNNKRGPLEREGQLGIQAIKALGEEMKDQYGNAEVIQRFESIVQWSVYQAKGALGETKEGGVNVAKSYRSFTDDRGVLLLEGNWYTGKDLKLTSASLEGVNEHLRPDIAAKPIGKLKIPKKIKLWVGPEKGFGEKYIRKQIQPFVLFSENETGAIWVNERNVTANRFLGENVGIRTQPLLEVGRAPLNNDQLLDAIISTFEEMKNKKPPLS